MPIDPSIVAGNKPEPFNPLETFAKGISIKNALTQGQIAQQGLQSNQAISQAIKNNTTDKGIDWDKTMQEIAGGGSGYVAPAFAESIAKLKASQTAADQAKFNLAKDKLNWITGSTAGLLNGWDGKKNLTNDYTAKLQEGVDNGLLTKEEALNAYKSWNPFDLNQQQQILKQHMFQGMDATAKLNAMKPDLKTFDTGAQTQVYNVNPVYGQGADLSNPLMTVNKQLSPSERLSVGIKVTDPVTGEERTLTKEQMQGGVPNQFAPQPIPQNQIGVQPNLTSEQAARKQMGYTPQEAEAVRKQELSNISSNLPAIDKEIARAKDPATRNILIQEKQRIIDEYSRGRQSLNAQPAQQQGYLTGLSPFDVKAKEADIARYNQLKTKYADYPTRITQLNDMKSALDKIEIGKGSGALKGTQNLIQSVSPTIAKIIGVDPKELATREGFDKSVAMFINQQHPGSDQRLSALQSGFPNAEMSTQGSKGIITKMIGLENYDAAKTIAFNKSGMNPSQFGQFETQWNTQIDPRAAIADAMSVKDRADYVSKFPKEDQAKIGISMAKLHKIMRGK